MICKIGIHLKSLRFLLLGVFCSFFSAILLSPQFSASAVSIWSTGRWGSGQPWHDFELQARSDLPYGAFPYNASTGGATLYGARIENGGYRVGDSSKRFNVVNIVFTLQQDLSFGSNTLNPNVPATGYVYDKNSNYISGPCSPYKEYDKLSWSCTINVDNYSDFEWFGIDIGNIHHPEAPLCEYDGNCPSDVIGYWAQFPTGQYGANLVYFAWSYNVSSSDDPVVSGISDLVNQNNQLIQQNNQILNSLSGLQQQQQQQYEAEQQKEAQQEQDIEDTQADAQQSADDSAEQASNVGSSLISAFTSLVSALHSVSLSSCMLPNFSIYGLNFNNMNLCSFSTPPGLMALGSIGMIFVIVPMGIALVKQLIGLYNELIGGKG